MHIAVRLRPADWLASAQAEGRRLVIASPEAARPGQPVAFRERARRFRTSLPAVVGRSVFMVVTSVSEGGCSLRWSGPAPQAGEAIRLRIGAGALACELRGVVRWVKSSSAATHVGVRLQPADGHARGWQAQVDQVSRSGAARC